MLKILIVHLGILIIFFLLKKVWLKEYANRLFLGIYLILMPIGFVIYTKSDVESLFIAIIGLLIFCFQFHKIVNEIKEKKVM